MPFGLEVEFKFQEFQVFYLLLRLYFYFLSVKQKHIKSKSFQKMLEKLKSLFKQLILYRFAIDF